MTIATAIATADALCPNTFTSAQKMNWLAALDARIMKEVYSTHQILWLEDDSNWISYLRNRFLPLYESAGVDISEFETEELEDDTVETTDVLLMPSQYEEAYIFYLLQKYALFSGEIGRANNYSSEFLSLYNAFVNFINRKFLPLQNNKITTE